MNNIKFFIFQTMIFFSQKIRSFLYLILFFILFDLINFIFYKNIFAILPTGLKIKNISNDWKDENHNQANRYSLHPRDESCGLGTVVGDMAYQYDAIFEKDNDDGQNDLFFYPRISLRHAYKWWDLFNGRSCQTWHGGKTVFAVKRNMTSCYKTGAGDSRSICVTTLTAPRNRRELYVRLAQIQTKGDISKASSHIKAVLNYDQAAINSGACDFRDIKLPWINYVKNNPEKFIAKYPGQDMICAFDITKVVIFSKENERCKNPEKCSSNWNDLIKCLLIPMGPAPKPFAPFVMGEEQVNIVLDESSKLEKPIARVIISKINQQFSKSFNLFDSSGKILKDSEHDFKIKYLEEINGTFREINSNYAFKFKIDNIEKKICGSIKSINSLNLITPREIGCIPIIGDPVIDLELINSGGNPFLWIKNYDNFLDSNLLGPIKIDELLARIKNNPDSNDNFYYDKNNDRLISVFRSGFHSNPYNIKNSFIVKKICSYNDQYIIFEPDYNCEDSTKLSSGKINLFICQDGELKEKISDCTSSIGKSTIGYKCNDGELILEGENCKSVSRLFDYEDDYAGELLCSRNLNFLKSDDSFFIPREYNNKKYYYQFSENSKVLIPFLKDFNLDKNPENFVKFSDLGQKNLDKLFNPYDQIFVLNDNGIEKRYSFERAFYDKNLTGGSESRTIFSDKNGPFFLEDEKFKNDYFYNASFEDFCLDLKNFQTKKEWNYTLQFPMYYANYDISSSEKDKIIYNSKLNFRRVDGVFSSKDPKISGDIFFSDNDKKDILMVSTKTKPIDLSSTEPKLAEIGFASEGISNETRVFKNTEFADKSIFFENFNVWSDFIESLNAKEVFYTDGNDLLNSGGNMFDTSDCNLIEFEIHSGGSSSEAQIGSGSTKNFVSEPSKFSFCQNNGHSGINGGYVRGSFFIRPNSNIIIKVGGPNGFISKNLNDLTLIENEGDFSAIWVKENGENNELLSSSELKLMVKVESGGKAHFCTDFASCSNLQINEIHNLILSNDKNKIFQLDDGSYSNFNLTSEQRRSFIIPSENFNSFDQNIAIDEFRGANFTSVCGKTDSLFDTIPFFFSTILNKYDEYGIIRENFMPDFRKDSGTGDFNKIGLYFFHKFSDSSKPLGSIINWNLRSESNKKFDTVCKKFLESCYNKSKLILDGEILKMNFGNDSSFGTDSKSVDDLNFYCPGLGGCYFSSEKKAISSSGSSGLVKISCKQYSRVQNGEFVGIK